MFFLELKRSFHLGIEWIGSIIDQNMAEGKIRVLKDRLLKITQIEANQEKKMDNTEKRVKNRDMIKISTCNQKMTKKIGQGQYVKKF